MAITADNVVQENSGTGTTVTLLTGTTAGNTVLICLTSASAVTAPSDLTLDRSDTGYVYVYRKSGVGGAETSWTFTTVSAAWYVVELSNVDLAEPLDSGASSSSGVAVSNGGTLSTGTAPLNAALNTVVFALFAASRSSSTESWSGYTNGFTEVAELSVADRTLAVASKFVNGATGTFQSTATLATTQAFANASAMVVAYRAADSPIVAPLAMFAGFEWGTHGGINSHNGATNMLGNTLGGASGTFGTSYLVQAGSARNSNYGLRIVQSASTAWVKTGNLGGVLAATAGFDARVVSGSGTVVVASISESVTSTGNLGYYAQLLYDTSTNKYGVRAGATGTTSWQSGTTALNTWVWIDLGARITGVPGNRSFTVSWRLETGASTYTDQTSATLTGQSTNAISALEFGLSASQTMTLDIDNVVLSRYSTAFPLGPHNIKLLVADPAGTPSVSGTSTNFSVFTSNGTLGAWNATNARNAVDEAPPTVSASADGVVQTATAANDYMEFPMATYTATATETIVGVRMLAPLWSGTGSGAGDLAIRGWDGTTETALATASQITPGSGTAISATVPVWRTAMWQSVNGWTQSELNAAALRVGFSGDATPDMGVHALYLEVAVGPTKARTIAADVLTGQYDPNKESVVSATLTPPADLDMTLRWTDASGSGSQAVTAGGSHTRQFNAASADEVSWLEVESEPELPDRE